ncbi:unnamed protein product, partial [Phaeothamnion confervicola]
RGDEESHVSRSGSAGSSYGSPGSDAAAAPGGGAYRHGRDVDIGGGPERSRPASHGGYVRGQATNHGGRSSSAGDGRRGAGSNGDGGARYSPETTAGVGGGGGERRAIGGQQRAVAVIGGDGGQQRPSSSGSGGGASGSGGGGVSNGDGGGGGGAERAAPNSSNGYSGSGGGSDGGKAGQLLAANGGALPAGVSIQRPAQQPAWCVTGTGAAPYIAGGWPVLVPGRGSAGASGGGGRADRGAGDVGSVKLLARHSRDNPSREERASAPANADRGGRKPRVGQGRGTAI